MFVSVQISNLTSLANVTDPKTALEAYQTILNNSVDGIAPFRIEVSAGHLITPFVFTPDKTQNCPKVTTSTSDITVSTSDITVSPSSYTTTSMPPMVTTTTVTVTETTTMSCSLSPVESPTTCPPNTPASVGVAQSRVVGIAFGTLITGSVASCISMVLCFLCYQKTRTRMWSPSTMGYQKQPDTVTEKEYFQ